MNRNFDSSALTQLRSAQSVARGVFVAQQSGARIISNPQTSNAGAGRIESYHVGTETAYLAGSVGGKGQTVLGASR